MTRALRSNLIPSAVESVVAPMRTAVHLERADQQATSLVLTMRPHRWLADRGTGRQRHLTFGIRQGVRRTATPRARRRLNRITGHICSAAVAAAVAPLQSRGKVQIFSPETRYFGAVASCRATMVRFLRRAKRDVAAEFIRVCRSAGELCGFVHRAEKFGIENPGRLIRVGPNQENPPLCEQTAGAAGCSRSAYRSGCRHAHSFA